MAQGWLQLKQAVGGDAAVKQLVSEHSLLAGAAAAFLTEAVGQLRSVFPAQPGAASHRVRETCRQLWEDVVSVCLAVLTWNKNWPVDHLQADSALLSASSLLLSWILEVTQTPSLTSFTLAFRGTPALWRKSVLIMMRVPFLCFAYHQDSPLRP